MRPSKSRLVLVYGPPHIGKSAAVLRLCDLLREHGLRVGGFVQRANADSQARRGYELVHLANPAETVELARPATARDAESSVCSFIFSPTALATGLAWLQADATAADVLVIDEVSKLETIGGGHSAAVRWALEQSDERTLLLSVRADELASVVETFDLVDRIRDYVELPAPDEQLAELARRLTAEA